MDCISTETKKHCTCTYTACDKRGNCCKCIAYPPAEGTGPRLPLHSRRGEELRPLLREFRPGPGEAARFSLNDKRPAS